MLKHTAKPKPSQDLILAGHSIAAQSQNNQEIIPGPIGTVSAVATMVGKTFTSSPAELSNVSPESYRRGMPELVYKAANDPDPQVRLKLQDGILSTSAQMSVVPVSIRRLYLAKQRLEKTLGRKFTISSMNLRCAVSMKPALFLKQLRS